MQNVLDASENSLENAEKWIKNTTKQKSSSRGKTSLDQTQLSLTVKNAE